MKILRNRLFQFIITAIVFASIGVIASNINATDVEYKNNKTVSDALDELYSSTGGNIGETYSSSNFGHERLTNMSTSLEIPKGKYICYAIYSASSAYNSANFNDSGDTTSLSASGCDSMELIKNKYNNVGASQSQISGTGTYHLMQRLTYVFKCDVNATKAISVSAANTAVNWIPWVITLDCTSVE